MISPAHAGRPAKRTAGFLVTLAVLAASPTFLAAQTIVGQVLDQVREESVGGVIVTLIEADGEERVRTLSDSVGRFVIEPPEAGEYILVTERFGYLETRSPLLALDMNGEAALELMISPAPIGLKGLEVSVEEQAAEELDLMGLSPASLGTRWISGQQIDAIPIKKDMGVILERFAPAGIQILRPENQRAEGDDLGLCVSEDRGRTGAGRGTCALVVVNGVPVSGIHALEIDADAIESIAILQPREAITFYGGMAGGGAVLVWTRRGR